MVEITSRLKVIDLKETENLGYTLVEDIKRREASLVIIQKKNTKKHVIVIIKNNLSWVIFDGSTGCAEREIEKLLNITIEEVMYSVMRFCI